MRRSAKAVALGGVLAALAVVIMCLGGLIPIATYVCPMLCILLGQCVYCFCGKRIAWAWYAAVALLALLIGPDKEAAGVYLFLGYYPYLKPWLDGSRFSVLWKVLYFNVSVATLYAALIFITGLDDMVNEYRQIGLIGLSVLLLLGNVTFFLADKLLSRFAKKRNR